MNEPRKGDSLGRRRDQHVRVTPRQRRLMQIIRSFGRPATAKEIKLRAARKGLR